MNRMNMKLIGILLVLFSFFLTAGAISANAITVSGVVTDTSGSAITAGVTVTGYWGGGIASTPVVTYDGNFSLNDIPASTPFFLMMTSSGYVPVITQLFTSAGSFSIGISGTGSSPFNMPTPAELTTQGLMPGSGKSVLVGRVVDETFMFSSNVKGAVVTAIDVSSKTYPVVYMGFNGLGGSSTSQNGRYFVLNVDTGTVIDLQASKPGWTFATPTASFYPPPGPPFSQGQTRLKGTAPAHNLSISGSVNSLTAPISGALVALRGDSGWSTTSAAGGTFTLGDLPRDATFYLWINATGYAPTYVGPITLQDDFSDAAFVTMTPAELATRGVTGSNGFVGGRVVDPTGTPLSGATIVVASKMGQTYTVHYEGEGTSTNTSGRFGIPNVLPNDLVRIQVTSAGSFFAPVFIDCWANSITETTVFATIPSVDVSQVYYSDSIRTIDNYNFSTGTKSGDTITIPGGFVTKPPAESGLSYTFGLFGTGYTLSWTAPNPCTVQMSGVTNGAVVIATTPALPNVSSAQTAWDYHVKLQKFTAVNSATDSVAYFAGMGSPDAATNQPSIEVSWLVNGHLQLTARVGEYDTPVWQATPIDLGAQPSVTTALVLRLQNTGAAINFYYTLNSGTETLIDTFESGDGYVAADYKGFPVLFPFVNLETESTIPVADPFHVPSAHWNNSNGNRYYANIFVDDLDQATYESISVASSGTPCGDNVPSTALTYGNGQWWLSPSVFLSENTPPGCFPSYTFTAVRKDLGPNDVIVKTVTGYVEAFATDLLPTGTITTATPTFSWTGIAGANGYVVQLSDDAYNQIWNVWVDAPTTQIIYTGPALVSGQTYYYTVNANVNTGGSTNLSMAEGSFTYSSAAVKSDFNADGKPDILWRNPTTGDNYVWFMDGTNFTGSALLFNVAAPWEIVGTGDFNADNKPDILWRNPTTGDNYVWFMDGTNFTGSSLLFNVAAPWEIVGTADFNSDNKPDILWRNPTTGDNYVWFMNGTNFTGSALLFNVPAPWEIVGANDFNADNKPDILWRNPTTGDNYVWFMNGTNFTGSALLFNVPAPWEIVGR
jgi:hypothetical protein